MVDCVSIVLAEDVVATIEMLGSKVGVSEALKVRMNSEYCCIDFVVIELSHEFDMQR